jgi:hypothetical protein
MKSGHYEQQFHNYIGKTGYSLLRFFKSGVLKPRNSMVSLQKYNSGHEMPPICLKKLPADESEMNKDYFSSVN